MFLLAVVPTALAGAIFGYLHIAPSHAAAASSGHGGRSGTADWWGASIGSVSPVARFVDDAALTRWYDTLVFEAPHPEAEPVTSGGGRHYARLRRRDQRRRPVHRPRVGRRPRRRELLEWCLRLLPDHAQHLGRELL